ncbi:TPA: hypothetical protein L1N00_004598, partial [Escherichia coli]|nr:hypothetical protein [Escherichia coli]HBN0479116.1 hypothetical protein [Escherichia coli]HBN0560878.1 hypothetical protein [Escherichia coli]HBN0649073.1 hypothetical protein [Escherichia coli]HEA1777357.1 hypothetical protein [Escherichia coli]
KKPVIQPENKEKIVKEEIKKKPFYMVEHENRFKSKLHKTKNTINEKIINQNQLTDENDDGGDNDGGGRFRM